MRYVTRVGDRGNALAELKRDGGQLFECKDSQGPWVIVCGGRCTTFWPMQSDRRLKVVQLAKKLGYPPEHATFGRIARWLLKETGGERFGSTHWDRYWHTLAKQGWHWHYSHCEPGMQGYLIEFDLQSAYWTAFTRAPSALLEGGRNWRNDGGCLNTLSTVVLGLPKAFRLQILGVLAQYEHRYFVVDENSPGRADLKFCRRPAVDWGGGFNAAHRAILYVYRLMKEVHRIAGGYCKRIHTDSFLLSPEIPPEAESKLFNLIETHGFKCSIKAYGDSWLWNVNEGIVGGQWIGSPQHVAEEAKRQQIRLKRERPPIEDLGNLSERVKRYQQLGLFNLKPEREDSNYVDYNRGLNSESRRAS